MASHVTLEAGTGLRPHRPRVTAPTTTRWAANTVSPFFRRSYDLGRFTEECEVPELVGKNVFEANPRIIEILKERGALVGDKLDRHHAYPHCWRSKGAPIIFARWSSFSSGWTTQPEPAAAAYASRRSRAEWNGFPPGAEAHRRHGGVAARLVHLAPAELGRAAAGFLQRERVARSCAATGSKRSRKSSSKRDRMSGSIRTTRRCGRALETAAGHDAAQRHARRLDRFRRELTGCGREEYAPRTRHADLYLEATDQHRGWFQSSLV